MECVNSTLSYTVLDMMNKEKYVDENIEEMEKRRLVKGLAMLREILGFNEHDLKVVSKDIEEMGIGRSDEEKRKEKSEKLSEKSLEILNKQEKELKEKMMQSHEKAKGKKQRWNKISITRKSNEGKVICQRKLFEKVKNEKDMIEYGQAMGADAGDY